MAALTVRLPDDKHLRLKALAESRGIPLNCLIDEMATLMLAGFDAETRFNCVPNAAQERRHAAWLY